MSKEEKILLAAVAGLGIMYYIKKSSGNYIPPSPGQTRSISFDTRSLASFIESGFQGSPFEFLNIN